MNVSILGCGWVGLPLARSLVSAGHTVKGSSTRASQLPTIQDTGARAYQLALKPELEQDPQDFFICDALIVTMPPPRGLDDERAFLVKQAEVILEHLPATAGLIVTSSTSVYAKRNQTVTENDDTPPKSTRGQALRAYEQAFRTRPAVILRLAGLFGEGRQPGRFLAGKTDVAGGAAPVNMVHGDDVVAAITQVLNSMKPEQVSGTFNICADTHPTRRAFFERAAAKANLTPPTFSDEPKPYAHIDNQRFKNRFGFTYRYPDVLAAL